MSWITRRFNGCLSLSLLTSLCLLLLTISPASAVGDLFSLQGNVYNSTGDPLPLGNLTVWLYENSTCGDYFYFSGSDFNYSINEGQYDVMLGNESLTELNVNASVRYLWLGTAIDGAVQSFNSTGGKCRSFSNPFYFDNATNYFQWRNSTYYSDEWWINRNTINVSNYNFTFNGSRISDDYYNKSEVHDLISSIAFELFLYNTSSSEIAGYNVMNRTSSEGAEQSIVVNVPADATPIQEFEVNASINNLATGLYSAHIHANATTVGAKDATIYWEGYVRYLNGTETLLVTSEETTVLSSSDAGYEIHGELDEEFAVNTSSDKFVAKFYANVDGAGANPDVWLLVEGSTFSRFELQTSADAFSDFYLRLDGSNADRAIDVNGYNVTTGHLLPDANSTYDLGTNNTRWRTLHLYNDILFDTNRYIAWNAGTMTIRGGLLSMQVSDLINTQFSYTQTRHYRSTIYNFGQFAGIDFSIRGGDNDDLIQVNATNHSFGFMTNDHQQDFNVNGTSNFTGNATFEDYVTADWLRGQFNWTENSTFLWFNGSTLAFDYALLNSTIDYRSTNSSGGAGEIYNGTFNQTDGTYIYNSTPFLINFNETLLNSTIDYRSINSSSGGTRKLSVSYHEVQPSGIGSIYSATETANITVQDVQTQNGANFPLYTPRTINYSILNLDGVFGIFYEFNVTGIDQDNNDYYEYQSGALGAGAVVNFESDRAFAIVYNHTLNMSLNGGLLLFVQVDVGRGNWIGLPNYPLTTVYKAVGNDGNNVQEVIVYNTTYGKVYLNETWARTGYTYWYES